MFAFSIPSANSVSVALTGAFQRTNLVPVDLVFTDGGARAPVGNLITPFCCVVPVKLKSVAENAIAVAVLPEREITSGAPTALKLSLSRLNRMSPVPSLTKIVKALFPAGSEALDSVSKGIDPLTPA